MTLQASVECHIETLRSSYVPKPIIFDIGTDLSLRVHGAVGPAGISDIAADLLDFAAVVFQVERQLPMGPGNPPQRFKLQMQMRNPAAWNDRAIKGAEELLRLLGNARWSLEFKSGSHAPIPEHERRNGCAINQVILFSGGLDSTCGAATRKNQADEIQLVSYYSSHQKNLQRKLAANMGYHEPVQWRLNWAKKPGKGHSFFYRSALFLVLAAVVAESWDTRTILQFENGILATAIPPAASWMMTKHAHPEVHRQAVELFSALFGGQWTIENPFLLKTKRGCVQEASRLFGQKELVPLLRDTETCWYHWSNRVPGSKKGEKKPNKPCGMCIPCILRQTAIPNEEYTYNLLNEDVRNHEKKGIAFRNYYGFLKDVHQAHNSTEFYGRLTPAGKRLVSLNSSITLENLYELYSTFAQEFMETFDLESSTP